MRDASGTHVGAYELVPTVTQRARDTAMTAYRLDAYTDELAAASSVTLTDPGNGGSVAWYVDYCASVLGEAFDRQTLSVHGSLG